MKHIILILALLCSHPCVLAQKYDPRMADLKKIIGLIKKNDAWALAKEVHYPLHMPNPIPDIKTKKDFIAYYPLLFDKEFKQKLINTKFDHSNTINRMSGFGIFNGDMWLDHFNGKIICINNRSPEALALITKLTKEIQQKMNKSVQPWKVNLYVCETDKYLFRIDSLVNDLRYISWNKPKSIADKPDLVLLHGMKVYEGGSMATPFYSFKDNDLVYRVDDLFDGGVFLKISQGDSEIANYECKVVK